MNAFLTAAIAILFTACASAMGFAEISALAQQGKWPEVIRAYEARLLEEGVSASVHYNLGYAHQQTGDHGRAVLAYERCLAMTPRAGDARHNLAELREETSLPAVRTLAEDLPAFTAWLSRDEWSIVFLVSLMVAVFSTWTMAMVAKKFRLVAAVALCLGTVLWIGSACVGMKRRSEDHLAVMLASGEPLRLSPFAQADEVSPCPAGSLLRVGQQQGNFVYVTLLPGDTSGWLPKEAVEHIAEP